MNDTTRFANYTDAAREVAAMRGWPDAKPVELDDDDGSTYWIIEAASGRYLRCDGYIR